MAEIFLYWIDAFARVVSRRPVPHFQRSAAFFLIVAGLLPLLALLGETFSVQATLVIGALLAIGWLVWARMGRWLGLSYPLLVGLLLLAVYSADTRSDLEFLGPVPASFTNLFQFIAPGLGFIFIFQGVSWALNGKGSGRAAVRIWLLFGLLVLPILLIIAWEAATASAWDVATDGLGGIFLVMLAGVVEIAAAMHTSWTVSPRRRDILFGIVVILSLVTSAATSYGTFGSDGAWGNVPHARTERRAESINRAILRYHESQGSYPQALSELTPNYLLYLPNPFIIPGQDWCFEGGKDYYRLGYVTRDFFSTPASVKVHAAAGQPPAQSWPCDAEADKYPGYGFFEVPHPP
jgi:hypothetical protein